MLRITRQALMLLAVSFYSTWAMAVATVSGNLQDAGGSPVSSRTFVRFWLRGCANNQPRVNGVALIVPPGGPGYYKDFTPDGSGAIAGSIYRNSEIECNGVTGNTWYGVQVYRDGKPGPETPYSVVAATFNLNTATPTVQSPPPPPATFPYIMANPIAAQTIANFPLSFGSGSGISANYQGSVIPTGRYLKSNGTNFVASSFGAAGVGNCSIAGQFVSALNGDAAPTCSGPPGGGTNGVIYNAGSAFASTAPGGNGTLCLVSTNGGAPAFSSCAGSASTSWSALSVPSSNLSLDMGANRTSFTWSGAVSGTDNGALRVSGGDSYADRNPTLQLFSATGFPFQILGQGGFGNLFRVVDTAILMGALIPLGSPIGLGVEFQGSASGVINRLVKLQPGGSLAALGTSDGADQALGIATGGTSTPSTFVTMTGLAYCEFDGGFTVTNWAVASTTTAGKCHDSGSFTPPGATIGQIVGSGGGQLGIILLKPKSTTLFLNRQLSSGPVTGTGSDANLYTATLGAGRMGPGKGIRIKFGFNHSTGTAAVTYKVKFGGSTVATVTSSAIGYGEINLIVFNVDGSTNAQATTAAATIVGTAVAAAGGQIGSSENTLNDVPLVATFSTAGTDQVTPVLWTMELVQ